MSEGEAPEESSALLQEIRRDYLVAKYPSHIRGLQRIRISPKTETESDLRAVLTPLRLHEVTAGQLNNQPPIQYRINFVKYVIKQLEQLGGDEEAVSVWYEALETLGGCHNQTEPFYRIYLLSRDESCVVKIFESESSFVAEGTTGLVTWEASLELSKWLLNESSSLHPKWIAELGCGCGFLAVANLKMFPSVESYLATDGSPSALDKCRLNVTANLGAPEATKKCRTLHIDWEKDEGKWKSQVESLDFQFGPTTGVLVGADVVFDPDLIPPLVRMIDVFLRTSRASQAFLASTNRNDLTFRSLKTQLESTGKTFQVVNSWNNGEILDIRLAPS